MTRSTVVVVFVVTELYQFLFGAFSSLQLAAPGVGDRASWVPDVLVGETYTILPLGFVACLVGNRAGRVLAALVAAASGFVALASAVTLSGQPVDVAAAVPWFALFAVPGIALTACILKMRPAPSND